MFDVFWSVTVAALVAIQPAPMISPGGIEAIGPKQDDPLTMCELGTSDGPGIAAGIIVQGGRTGVEAIGPKQDDPSRPGSLARPGDDNDPKAAGGANGGGVLAIGPKQDDPRAPLAMVARPGDDDDPQALAKAGKCGKAKL